ncbi:MAG: acetylornithine/N-succinyldiaminopimelate aminotransferase [Bacteroidia bacterium]
MISHRQAFLDFLAQTSDAPMGLEVKKARGIYVQTTDGKRYIDLISGIGVSSLGHRNTKILQAIRKQLGKYLHTMVFGEHIQAPQVKLARSLAKALPDPLSSTFFVNSGSEAIEGALKLAKRHTKRHKIVAMENAYHGSSHGCLSLMSDPYYSNFYRPLLPEVYFATFNDIDSLNVIDQKTAAVVVEMVQGEGGYIAGNQYFISELRAKCTQMGCILIVDEIQSGMGRTGSLFAFEQYNIVPDILCLAKAFGGGMPLGAFVARKELMMALSSKPVLGHISTFGGHPVSCAAALTSLDILQSTSYIAEVKEKEALFRSLLMHPKIIQITGKGLMLGVELESPELLQKVVANCIQQGVIIDWFLFDTKKLRISPPLIITKAEIKRVCKILTNVLAIED